MYFLFLILAILTGCSNSDSPNRKEHRNQKGEFIYRKHNEFLYQIPTLQSQVSESYPWEKKMVGNHIKITKDFFRCKGSTLNPVHVVQQNGEVVHFFDCGGAAKHSLPLCNGKEFVYPILIDLLNYIQGKTQKRVVITSGHRCPDHNTYVDPSTGNNFSKHMIGAEVSFYVQGLEDRPEVSVKLIQDYYKETPKYAGKKDYIEFQRYEKGDSNVAMLPWYNKEVFIKLFNKKEGRNFDNRHPYPYLSIQVRYDYDTQERVIYTWDKAQHNFLRH